MDDQNDHGMLEEENPDGEERRQEVVPRDPPQPSPGRAALVTLWNTRVEEAKTQYAKRFEEMRKLQRFARGEQWNDNPDAYVTNVTLRHLRQQVSRLYAKNPRAVARVRERLEATVWDGTVQQVMEAQQILAMAQQAAPALASSGRAADFEAVAQQVMQAQAILADFEQVRALRKQLERMARTASLLYEYNIDEQALPFKTMMKQRVLQAKTVGVSYVKLGFQRATQLKPDAESRIHDISVLLRRIEQGSADLADGKIDPESAQAEQLRAEMQQLLDTGETLVREGLTFDYPAPTSIIPDLNCRHLKTFQGCHWVAQEYLLPVEEVQRIYGVDVRGAHNTFSGRKVRAADSASWEGKGVFDPATALPDPQGDLALIREIYYKPGNTVYVVCDGYPEFLQEPGPPDVWTERFWPWFPLVFNEVDDPDDAKHPFPPSDVELIRDAQMEINRSREGLREHRIANRPGYAAPRGTLSDEDKGNLQHRPAHAIVELDALAPGQDVKTALQGLPSVPIDPNLYETNSNFEDILRAGGLQEANLGPTSGATATESSIAQASLSTVNNSDVDELDDFLTLLARSGGQILLLEVSITTAREIVGPGAVWPALSRDQVARDLWLEIEAGSTGRPNQAQEIANFERMVPLLIQIPGVNPVFLAREGIRRLDDRLDIDQALSEGLPSVVSMNSAMRPATGNPATDPDQQGGQGSQKARPGEASPDAPQGVDTTSEGPPDPDTR